MHTGVLPEHLGSVWKVFYDSGGVLGLRHLIHIVLARTPRTVRTLFVLARTPRTIFMS